MIAIGEVYVGVPRVTEHDPGARRDACFGMTSQILLTDIGFGLGDQAHKFFPLQDANEPSPNQLSRDFQSWTVIKITSKNAHW